MVVLIFQNQIQILSLSNSFNSISKTQTQLQQYQNFSHKNSESICFQRLKIKNSLLYPGRPSHTIWYVQWNITSKLLRSPLITFVIPHQSMIVILPLKLEHTFLLCKTKRINEILINNLICIITLCWRGSQSWLYLIQSIKICPCLNCLFSYPTKGRFTRSNSRNICFKFLM